MNQDKQPEAMRIASSLQKRYDLFPMSDEFAAVAELNRQHARIAELEAELAATQPTAQGVALHPNDVIRLAGEVGLNVYRGDGWPDEQLIAKPVKFAAQAKQGEQQ